MEIMHKMTFPAAFAILFWSVAAAAAYTATGTITSMSATKHTITLSNGRVYTIPASLNITTVQKGDRVKVTYSKAKNVRTASNVVVVAAVPTPKTTTSKTVSKPTTAY
jgi:hypothetical protein